MGPVIVIAVLLGLGWIALAIPWRRRQRSHAAMQDDVIVGNEIITAGGIHGVVKQAGERELQVEIATGVVVTLDRRAVAAVAVDDDDDDDQVPREDDDQVPNEQGENP